jgi:shikimate kinase
MINHYRTSLVLIGMPGAGKTTIGKHLAKSLLKDFVDTDELIQQQYGQSLQSMLEATGHAALLQVEAQTLLSVHAHNHVIATGGSAVYSEAAMHHLKSFGPIIFLDVALEELRHRITDFDTRGVIRSPSQNLDDLFKERRELYLTYADIHIECNNKPIDAIVHEIIAQESENYRGEDA